MLNDLFKRPRHLVQQTVVRMLKQMLRPFKWALMLRIATDMTEYSRLREELGNLQINLSDGQLHCEFDLSLPFCLEHYKWCLNPLRLLLEIIMKIN